MFDLISVKNFIRVDHDEDDNSIEKMIDAAKCHLQSLGVDYEQDPLPSAIHHATLMLIAEFYEHRESQIDTPLYQNLAFQRLIAPFTEKT